MFSDVLMLLIDKTYDTMLAFYLFVYCVCVCARAHACLCLCDKDHIVHLMLQICTGATYSSFI